MSYSCAVRKGPWKYVTGNPGSDRAGVVGWVDEDGIGYDEHGAGSSSFSAESRLLFNVFDDPAERHDVSQSHPDVLAELRAFLRPINASKASFGEDADGVPWKSLPDGRPIHGVWQPWDNGS